MKPSQEGAMNLPEIQRHNAQCNSTGGGLWQFGGQQPQAALALGQADAALDLHPLTNIGVVLIFVGEFILFRPAQGRPGKPDVMLFGIIFSSSTQAQFIYFQF